MIESTLRFDDVEDVPGLLPLLRAVQRSHMRSREQSGRRPGNEDNTQHVRPPTDTPLQFTGIHTKICLQSMTVFNNGTWTTTVFFNAGYS